MTGKNKEEVKMILEIDNSTLSEIIAFMVWFSPVIALMIIVLIQSVM